MTHGSLFTGIGGFDLAARWMGWQNSFQVEKDPFCQKVLRKNFPNEKRYKDIRQFDGAEWRGKVDVLTGGFPCQPFSTAGKREGRNDDRYLWPEMLRVIREIQPAWIVGENVAGILSMEDGQTFETILTSLEDEGYAVQPFVIPALAVEASHRRDRVWIVAHARCERWAERPSIPQPSEARQSCGMDNPGSFTHAPLSNDRQRAPEPEERPEPQPRNCNFGELLRLTESPVCRADDGLSGRVDKYRRKRLKALGNAIVPKVAFEIFTAIEKQPFRL